MGERIGIAAGVGDLMAELYAIPMLRPQLQYEIESLFGLPLGFELRDYVLRLTARDESAPGELLISNHGRGIQYFVALFFYLYHPRVRVILIDEPENSLHPQLQRALLQRIRTVAREHNKQIFIATHSPIFALPRTTDDLEGIFVLRRTASTPRIVNLSSAVPEPGDERRRFESYLPNLDPAITEVFFSKAALIVEGQTERQFLYHIASKTGRDPAGLGVSIIEAGGLALMPSLLRIARSMALPWRAVCDLDLLTSKKTSFNSYRDDFSALLGSSVELCSSEPMVAEKRNRLRSSGIFVTTKLGLEYFYRSKTATEYLMQSDIKPADKGWLMAEEVRHLESASMSIPDIESAYGEYIEPLKEVMMDASDISGRRRSEEELVMDLLFDDADQIHRRVHRERLSEKELQEYLNATEALSEYSLQFTSSDEYTLTWSAPRGGKYRIRCAGQRFYVEHANKDEVTYSVLREATVGEVKT
jgi:hypothetical protein